MKLTDLDRQCIRAVKRDRFKQEMFNDIVLAQVERGGPFWWPQAQASLASYMNMIEDKPIYRICINDDTTVSTDCYDMLENFAPELNTYYSGVDELPKWAQDRLAVLSLLDPKQVNQQVEGVGKRINEHIFWLFKESSDGDDARGEG